MKIRSFVFFTALTASALAAPVSLFDGKTLDGWESREPKLWKVEDGCITGGNGEKVPHNDFICTKRSFSNFVLKLKIKLTGDPKTGMINSGVQIRSMRDAAGHEVSGYQCDYGEPGWYGGIYDEARRNKFLVPADMDKLRPVIRLWDWNEYVIRAEGNRIQTWINGVPGVDYREEDPNIPQDGIIGIQVHSGGNAVVQVKDITIEELPPGPDAPTWGKLGGVEGVRAKVAPQKKGGAKKDPEPNRKTGTGVKPMKEGNAISTVAKTPQEERALLKVPEGFEVELVAAESEGIGKFVPLAFDQRGALWTTTALEYPVDGNENPAAADALYASKAKDKVLVFDRDPNSPTGLSSKPRVFAEGLAIPLGVLPYKNGCYVQHGHDIVFLEDTDNDGKADKRTVILTGFGVQDSHLFPHQFMRAPGGWIWMAQGAFNYSKVRRPDEPAEKAVQFDQTRMAKFRPDGSGFDITSNGPCNIWGLVLNGEGEAFIQEANDFGYPVMPFHEYANYPGCSDRQWKSYAPEFPGTAPDFKMGGTGLSGLALTDKNGPFPEPWRDMMLVANPITNRIQAIKMHRDGPRWKLDPPQDFLVSADPWFRPVAITVGPDGCLYIVDWYNKIISHNEVPRNHPDRDKTRGRIWRVKAKATKPFDVPDFTKLSGDELIAKLGGDSLAQSHLAWQAIGDRGEVEHADRLLMNTYGRGPAPTDEGKGPPLSVEKNIASMWAAEGLGLLRKGRVAKLMQNKDPNIRRQAIRIAGEMIVRDHDKAVGMSPKEVMEAARAGKLRHDPEKPPEAWIATLNDELTFEHSGFLWLMAPLADDPDAQVRAQLACSIGSFIASMKPGSFPVNPHGSDQAFGILLSLAREPLAEPMGKSTRNGKPIKVREAYDREFERYLVRMFLEKHPEAVARFLDTDDAKKLPVEARLLASLSLESKVSAARVAKLLPQLQRAPGQEEVLRLAQFPDEPGVGEGLRAILSDPKTSAASLETLFAVKTRLDPNKLAPILTESAKQLLASTDDASIQLGIKLAGAFNLTSIEEPLVALLRSTAGTATPRALAAVRALSALGSNQSELFTMLAETSQDAVLRDEALAALAGSKAADAPPRVLALYPKLAPSQRHTVLERLSATKPGAKAIVSALNEAKLAASDLDASILDRLQAVLGPNDPALAKLADKLGSLFRPVLSLDGSEAAWTQTRVVLDGPCTIEAWVRLDPDKRKIGNADGIAGAPGQLDFNFFAETPRIYVFPPLGDVVAAKKPVTPGLWTHVAATRDPKGIWKIYMDGELSATGTTPAPHRIENIRLAWTSAQGGTRGALSEVRLWNRERTADEVRAASDRSLTTGTPGLLFTSASGDWGKLQKGAKVIKSSDFPPILTGEEAAKLDTAYAKNRALAEKPGDPAKGKAVAAICQACHLMGTTGGNIGPNLSGVGAMGTEAILRNIIQPNAAMENGYRIYRVELKSGDLVDALYVSEDKAALVVRMPGADDRRIPKSEIRSAKFLRRSLMPEGLLDGMTPEQVSDLFAYLRTLK